MREKLKNKSWLFLIWEIIKKKIHYYFNKKNSFNRWEKIGAKIRRTIFCRVDYIISIRTGILTSLQYNPDNIRNKIVSWN